MLSKEAKLIIEELLNRRISFRIYRYIGKKKKENTPLPTVDVNTREFTTGGSVIPQVGLIKIHEKITPYGNDSDIYESIYITIEDYYSRWRE